MNKKKENEKKKTMDRNSIGKVLAIISLLLLNDPFSYRHPLAQIDNENKDISPITATQKSKHCKEWARKICEEKLISL